jgi:membrane-bound serine protease (ClpP class)
MYVPIRGPRFPLFHLLVTTIAILIALAAAPSTVQAQSSVLLATYDGVINPVSAEYLHDAIASAQEDKAQALIFRLNTPGGLDTSMRLIIKDITGATIPVIVYVSPSSGRAASAGARHEYRCGPPRRHGRGKDG